MEFIQSIMSWFSSQSWTEIAGVISLWIIAFRALADITPTTKDNAVLGWLETIFKVLGVKVPDVQVK
jgi:hypothetical protein